MILIISKMCITHDMTLPLTPQARVRQHKLKLPKTSGMSGLGLDVMAGGSIFDSDVVDTPSMALVDPVLGGQVSLSSLLSVRWLSCS